VKRRRLHHVLGGAAAGVAATRRGNRRSGDWGSSHGTSDGLMPGTGRRYVSPEGKLLRRRVESVVIEFRGPKQFDRCRGWLDLMSAGGGDRREHPFRPSRHRLQRENPPSSSPPEHRVDGRSSSAAGECHGRPFSLLASRSKEARPAAPVRAEAAKWRIREPNTPENRGRSEPNYINVSGGS